MDKLQRLLGSACTLAIAGLIAGCGGSGGGDSSPAADSSAPQSVSGIAAPDTISVVTANNADN